MDDSDLLGCQVRESGFQFFEGNDIGKEYFGVYQIFVDIVEIFQQQIPPKIEILKFFVCSGSLEISFVKFDRKGNIFCFFDSGLVFYKFIKCKNFGHPGGLIHQFRQGFRQEEPCSFIGKNDCQVFEVTLIFCNKVLSNQLNK